VRREDDIDLKSGPPFRQESKVSFTLKRGPRGWTIQEIHQEAVKGPSGTSAADSGSRGSKRP
jgi:hypothetical protein